MENLQTGWTNNYDPFLEHPWTLMVMGWIGWYIIKAGMYWKERLRARKKPSFKEWLNSIAWNLVFTIFCSYFIIVWDDEIIALYFTGDWERFGNVVYIMSGPISSTLWYLGSHWDVVIEKLVVFFFGKFIKK